MIDPIGDRTQEMRDRLATVERLLILESIGELSPSEIRDLRFIVKGSLKRCIVLLQEVWALLITPPATGVQPPAPPPDGDAP